MGEKRREEKRREEMKQTFYRITNFDKLSLSYLYLLSSSKNCLTCSIGIK